MDTYKGNSQTNNWKWKNDYRRALEKALISAFTHKELERLITDEMPEGNSLKSQINFNDSLIDLVGNTIALAMRVGQIETLVTKAHQVRSGNKEVQELMERINRDYPINAESTIPPHSLDHDQTAKEIKALQDEIFVITEKKIEFLNFLDDKLLTANKQISRLLQSSPDNSDLVKLKEQVDELLAKIKSELMNDGKWMATMRVGASVRKSKRTVAKMLADS